MGAMENINYDLVKLLQNKLHIVWELENSYIDDAEEAKCHSVPALKEILEDERRHVKMLAEEIRLRAEAGKFE